jgi:hypothetical protein
MLASLRNLAVAGTAAAALAAPALAGDHGAYHVMYTPEYAAKIGRVPHLPSGGQGAMNWYGGTVFSKVNVVSVIWGTGVDKQTVSGMPGFMAAIVNSTYLDMLDQYSTKGLTSVDGKHHGKQTVARGTFFGQVQITPHNTSINLTDGDIHKELKYQISTGALPKQSPNTLYMIFFPNNITITLDGLVSCQSFGAYHFATNDKKPTKNNIFYGVMPGCGYSFADHTIVSSHEFAEATTDNIPTPGSSPAYPQAWNNSSGYEIGDLCEGTQGNLVAGNTTYLVQQLYLNSTAGCSTGNYTSP